MAALHLHQRILFLFRLWHTVMVLLMVILSQQGCDSFSSSYDYGISCSSTSRTLMNQQTMNQQAMQQRLSGTITRSSRSPRRSTSTALPASLSSPSPSPSLSTPSSSKLSPAAQWHNKRRKEMISKNDHYANQILPLEQQSHGLYVGLPLLLLSNMSLAALSILSSQLSVLQVVALAVFPGSMFSLWQLQICHDCLHGALLPKRKIKIVQTDTENGAAASSFSSSWLNGYVKYYHQNIINWIVKNRIKLHSTILFWCSMPNAFGYYLYLQYGHLTHHKSLGDETKSNLETLFDSSSKYFEDGDALFVAHRMKLKGGVGPKFKVRYKVPELLRGGLRRIHRNSYSNTNSNNNSSSIITSGVNDEINSKSNTNTKTITNEKTITMSISNSGFSLWKEGHPLRNALAFTSSFLFERILLIMNDFVVAITGKNFFFLNKPQSFHNEVANYCRVSCLVKLALWYISGSWKSLLFLYFAETLWSIPPHPACAMFITNHGSGKSEITNENDDNTDIDTDGCIPSSSTYAGRLYSLFTLGTNYHVEHHDFPTIPLHKLGKLQEIAPEYYRNGVNSGSNNSSSSRNNSNKEEKKKKKRDNVFAIMKKTFSEPEFYACMDAGIRLD